MLVSAGAQFTVSPTVRSGATRAAVDRHVPAIAGAMTPTEVLACTADGAFMVKLFPAVTLGPGFIKQIKAPLPHIRFVATGGVGLAEAPCTSTPVPPPWAWVHCCWGIPWSPGDMDALRERARAWARVLNLAPANMPGKS